MSAAGDPTDVLVPPDDRTTRLVGNVNFLALTHQLVLIFMDPGRVVLDFTVRGRLSHAAWRFFSLVIARRMYFG